MTFERPCGTIAAAFGLLTGNNRMRLFKKAGIASLAAAALLLAGCTTTGMGGGEIIQKGQPDKPVLFSWKSTDGGITGTMTATLPTATFQGPFLQITQQTQGDAMAPMWGGGWPVGWSDWSYWGYGSVAGMGGMGMMPGFDSVQFATVYSGKVIANLKSPQGGLMRCRLHMHQMALADAADRRIAAHRTDGLDVVGQQQRACAGASRRERRFGAGMAAADHDHIETVEGVAHRAGFLGLSGQDQSG